MNNKTKSNQNFTKKIDEIVNEIDEIFAAFVLLCFGVHLRFLIYTIARQKSWNNGREAWSGG